MLHRWLVGSQLLSHACAPNKNICSEYRIPARSITALPNVFTQVPCLAMVLTVFLLVCMFTYTVTAQQGGCNSLSTTNGLINGTGKTGVIPNVQAPSGGTIIILVIVN